MQKKHIIALAIGIPALILVSAGASALITQKTIKDDQPVQKVATVSNKSKNNIQWNDAQKTNVQPVKAAAKCDDGNIVGYIAGGTAGGIAGSTLGKGNGQTATTIAGTLGGAYLGGEYLPTRNVTCAQ
jgi:uncharacterized protein YcfJ